MISPQEKKNFLLECWSALCWLEGIACVEREKRLKQVEKSEWEQ